MRTADDFRIKIKEKPVDIISPIDKFIENEIYSKLHPDGSVGIYMNLIQMEGIDLKQLKSRLKELKFKTSQIKEGVDDVLYIQV